jgi:hypothetical protein
MSELYRLTDRSLSAKLVPTFADRGCHDCHYYRFPNFAVSANWNTADVSRGQTLNMHMHNCIVWRHCPTYTRGSKGEEKECVQGVDGKILQGAVDSRDGELRIWEAKRAVSHGKQCWLVLNHSFWQTSQKNPPFYAMVFHKYNNKKLTVPTAFGTIMKLSV